LEHTLSLVKLCRKVGEHYPGIDIDILQTGAVLHDFGKIDELSYERGFGYTNEGQMIGHLVMETIMVSDHIKQIPGFPEELRRHLLHLLLAHHGKLEYGSPKLPSTPEALMLAYLDDLDSKIEAMQRLMGEPHTTGDWTRISPMFERPIYRRRPNQLAAASEPAAPALNQASSAVAVSTTKTENTGGKQKTMNNRSDSFNTPFEQLADILKETT
ncbi:MAG: HD domain-containing protein, partial [Acidobacteria bacterium]|nr:HD domain-containing protein [Acidobacteriota bacterium]